MATLELDIQAPAEAEENTIVLPFTNDDLERETTLLQQRRSNGLGISWPEFANDVLHAHTDLISMWGGMRFHTDTILSERADPTELYRLMYDQAIATASKIRMHDFPYDRLDLFYYPNWRKTGCKILSLRNAPEDITFEYNLGGHTVSVRKGQSYSRAILADIKKRYKGHNDPELVQAYISMWEQIFSKIGELWSVRNGIRVSASVSPHDFAWPGDLEREQGSSTCFRTNGEWEWSKYNLAMIPNSFVLLFYRKAEEETTDPNQLLCAGNTPDGRCFGIYHPKGIFLTNIYGLNHTVLDQLLPQIIESAFGISNIGNHDPAHTIHRALSGENFYANGDYRNLTPKDQSPKDTSEFFGEVSAAIRNFYHSNNTYGADNAYEICDRCEGEFNPEDLSDCSNCENSFCSSCCRFCDDCEAHVCLYCSPSDEWVVCSSQYTMPGWGRHSCLRQLCSHCADKSASCSSCGDTVCSSCEQDRRGIVGCEFCSTITHDRASCSSMLVACNNDECESVNMRSCEDCACEHIEETFTERREKARIEAEQAELKAQIDGDHEQALRIVQAEYQQALLEWNDARINVVAPLYDNLSREEQLQIAYNLPMVSCNCQSCVQDIGKIEEHFGITPPPAPEAPNV
jgi:hypothetical protein